MSLITMMISSIIDVRDVKKVFFKIFISFYFFQTIQTATTLYQINIVKGVGLGTHLFLWWCILILIG